MTARTIIVGTFAVLAVGVGVALAVDGSPAPQAGPEDALTLRQLVGQRIVTGYIGSTPTESVLTAARRGRIGGVILFGDNVPSERAAKRAVRRLQKAAKGGGQPPLLVMIDQEGGVVKRLPNAPPDRSPARIGGASNPAGAARIEGAATGKALRDLGIYVNLAPVADVPRVKNSFLGTRAFGRDRNTVADAACAFAYGLGENNVAATFKHFPGLGWAPANTDDGPVRVRASAARIKADLLPYRRCGSTLPMAMVSSATYPALGIRNPAVLTRAAYDLLGETGFTGVTISDALDTPAIANRKLVPRRALLAGLDLLLYGQTRGAASRAFNALLSDAKAGRITETQLRAAAAEILALKERLEQGALAQSRQ